ncbi:hypothetical protein BH24ACT2_BH24ACT2_07390 [soil metagenome]
MNDNGGRLYRFAPTEDRECWISVDLWNDPEQRIRLLGKVSGLTLDDTWEGALGMVKRTDALLLGRRDAVAGLDLRPYDPGRRGAWYSLGFLLRADAARLREPRFGSSAPSTSSVGLAGSSLTLLNLQ